MTQAPELSLHGLIRSGEAARLIGVSVRTIKRWDDKGYLASVRTPEGTRFYRRADVEALLTVHDNGAA